MAQVVPLDDDEEQQLNQGSEIDYAEENYEENSLNGDVPDEVDEFESQLIIVKKNWLVRDIERFWNSLSYGCLKQRMNWCLIDASIKVSVTVSSYFPFLLIIAYSLRT